MVTLTTEVLQPLQQPTLPGMGSVISSPASGDGVSPCASPGGRTTELCGAVRALANPTAWQGRALATPTPATSGPNSAASSASANLQSCLASRLQARLAVDGSPEYSLTWKAWAMPSRAPICALRASPRRTSGSGCIGWPTPASQNGEGGPIHGGDRGFFLTLQSAVITLDGWPTCQARDSKGAPDTPQDYGNARPLNEVAIQLAGYPTPRTPTGGPESTERKRELGRTESGGGDLESVVRLMGWPTATQTDGERRGQVSPEAQNVTLNTAAAQLAGWDTPTLNDVRNPNPRVKRAGPKAYDNLSRRAQLMACRGMIAASPSDATPSGGSWPAGYRLNPCFSLWLMGFPVAAWVCCGARAMRSCRTSRRNS